MEKDYKYYGIEMYDRVGEETFIYAYKSKNYLNKKIDRYKEHLSRFPEPGKILSNEQREEFDRERLKSHMHFDTSPVLIRNVKNINTVGESLRDIESSTGEYILLIERLWSGY